MDQRSAMIFGVAAAITATAVIAIVWWRYFASRALKNRAERIVEEVADRLAWAPHLEPRFIECGNDRIHYVQAGRGPHLVLLHGIGASIFIWRFMISELAKDFTVTALDLPGFGMSTKRPGDNYGLDRQRERVRSFLDALGIERAYLAGSSMGGAIALWLAHGDPKRFPDVAVLAPATAPEIIPLRLSRLASRAPLAHRTLNRVTMKLILGRVIGKPELIVSETIDTYLRPYRDQGESVRTFLAALQLLGDKRIPSCFTGLKSQVLILYGERDSMVSRRSIERLCKVLPNSRLVTHPTGAHHIMEDEPNWTLDQLRAFFLQRDQRD